MKSRNEMVVQGNVLILPRAAKPADSERPKPAPRARKHK